MLRFQKPVAEAQRRGETGTNSLQKTPKNETPKASPQQPATLSRGDSTKKHREKKGPRANGGRRAAEG